MCTPNWVVGLLLVGIDAAFHVLDRALSLGLRGCTCRRKRGRRAGQQERQRVVIIGAGFAGLHALRRLRSRFDVTLIDRKRYFEYTPGILRAFVEPAWLDRITTPLPPRSSSCCCDSLPRLLGCVLSLGCCCCGLLGGGGCDHDRGDDSVAFVCGQATHISSRSVRVRPSPPAAPPPQQQQQQQQQHQQEEEQQQEQEQEQQLLQEGPRGDVEVEVEFDFLLVGSGSAYAAPIKSAYQPAAAITAGAADESTLEGRRATFTRFHARLCRAQTVLIVGAGPVGVELAAEILSAAAAAAAPARTAGSPPPPPLRRVILTDMASEVCPTLPPHSRAHLSRWLLRPSHHGAATCELELGVPIGGTFPHGLLIDERGATLADGRRLEADVVFRCTGFRPETVVGGGESSSSSSSSSSGGGGGGGVGGSGGDGGGFTAARSMEEGCGSPAPPAASARLAHDSRSGALLVDNHLRLLRADGGGPALGGAAFAMGDCCLHAASAEPKLGHTAEVNAELVARNVLRLADAGCAGAAAAAAAAAAGGSSVGVGVAPPLLSYPRGVVGAAATPRIYCVSLGKYDASLCFNGLVINGALAALVKHVLEVTKVAACRGSVLGCAFWDFADWMAPLMGRTLLPTPSVAAAKSQ